MSARVTTVASAATRLGIAGVVLGGVWALATGRIDGARLTGVWLLALAFGGTVEQVSRMVPELQYALGAWGRVQLLQGGQAGAGRRGDADRRRPRHPRPDVPLPGRGRRWPGGAAGRRADVRPGPVVRADRAHRVGQVDAGQGAHPGRRGAARHGVPRRHRHPRSGSGAAAPVDRGGAAAHRDPGRHARREHRAVRPGAARAGRPGADRARPHVLGRRAARRHPDPARRRRVRAVGRAGAAGRVRPDPGPATRRW